MRLILCLLIALTAHAQTTQRGSGIYTGYQNFTTASWSVPQSTIANLPAASSVNSRIYLVTDADHLGDCTLGGGTLYSFLPWCRSNGTSWICVANCDRGSAVAAGVTGDVQIKSVGGNLAVGSMRQDATHGNLNASKTLNYAAPSTPTFVGAGTTRCDLSASNMCVIHLTGNTTLALDNPAGSGPYFFLFDQDGFGGRTITYPASMVNPPAIDPTANRATTFLCFYYPTFSNYYCFGSGGGASGDTPFKILGPERGAPDIPGPGQFALWPDSADHLISAMHNNSSQRSYMIPMVGDFAGSSPALPTLATGAVSAAKLASSLRTKVACTIDLGSDTSIAVLINPDLGPQLAECKLTDTSTLFEIWVSADAGSPSVTLGRVHAGTVTNLTSAALATGASGAEACANTGGTAGVDGVTTCSGTLAAITFVPGDRIKLVSGTAGGIARHMVIYVLVRI